MESSFWSIVASYTDTLWWFSWPALALGAAALLLLGAAAFKLHQRNLPVVLLMSAAVGAALALAMPGVLLAWRPGAMLGIDLARANSLPSATFPATAQVLDRAMQMGYLSAALLLVGGMGVLGVVGKRATNPCPNCGRPRHRSWNSVCPECKLMEPSFAESPLMRLGDLSASGVDVTSFGMPSPRTALLHGTLDEPAAIEVTAGPSGLGERFTVGARLTIGRDPSQCQMVLDDESVSSRHAYVERDHAVCILYDWGSRNGTFVNDEQITQRVLHNGDLIRIGRAEARFTQQASDDSAPTQLLDVGMSHARLVLLDDDQPGQSFALDRLDTAIGRGQQNDVTLDSPTVSRHHASIRFDGAAFYLIDAGTANGTWIDDVRVLGSTRLHAGQTIRLGNQRLRFEQEGIDAAN